MRHADPIVLDGEALGILVERNPDREGVRRERWVGERLIAQFLASIGGIGKEFAQKNIAIRIDRMHHEMQQFGNIRLKSLTVTLSLRHVRLPPFQFQMRFHGFRGYYTAFADGALLSSPMAKILPRCPADARLRARLFVLESSQAQKRIRFFGNLSQKR